MHDSVEAQKQGIPTISVVTEEFKQLAETAARALGYPDLPMVVVPHPFEILPVEDIERLAEEKFREIIEKVTLPKA